MLPVLLKRGIYFFLAFSYYILTYCTCLIPIGNALCVRSA